MAGLDGISTLTQGLGSLGPSSNVGSTTSIAETAVSGLEKSGKAAAETVVTDTTNVSSTSGLIAAALNTPDVRLDKVAALQTQISNGTYSVSSSDVASKIVDSLLR